MKSFLLRFIVGAVCVSVVGLLPNPAIAAETIYACAHKNLGNIRVVAAPGHCLKSEYELSWEDGLAVGQKVNELLGRVSAIESALGVINEAPTVIADDDQTTLVSITMTLGGTAEDDGLLQPLSFMWEELSNSSAVLIHDPNNLLTSVEFNAVGAYDFRLSVSDGAITVSDELRIIVYPFNTTPVILKGADPLIIPAYRVYQSGHWVLYCPNIDLGVTVTDDNLPTPLSFGWSIESTDMYPELSSYNETNVVFFSSPSNSVEWPLHMAAKQLYSYGLDYLPLYLQSSLSLTVNDGYHTIEDSLLVQCDVRASAAPIVDAGEDQSMVGTPYPGSYRCQPILNGTAEDDGFPGPIGTIWHVWDISPLGTADWGTGTNIIPQNTAITTAYLTVFERTTGYVLPDSVTFKMRLMAGDGYSSTVDYTSVTCIKP